MRTVGCAGGGQRPANGEAKNSDFPMFFTTISLYPYAVYSSHSIQYTVIPYICVSHLTHSHRARKSLSVSTCKSSFRGPTPCNCFSPAPDRRLRDLARHWSCGGISSRSRKPAPRSSLELMIISAERPCGALLAFSSHSANVSPLASSSKRCSQHLTTRAFSPL